MNMAVHWENWIGELGYIFLFDLQSCNRRVSGAFIVYKYMKMAFCYCDLWDHRDSFPFTAQSFTSYPTSGTWNRDVVEKWLASETIFLKLIISSKKVLKSLTRTSILILSESKFVYEDNCGRIISLPFFLNKHITIVVVVLLSHQVCLVNWLSRKSYLRSERVEWTSNLPPRVQNSGWFDKTLKSTTPEKCTLEGMGLKDERSRGSWKDHWRRSRDYELHHSDLQYQQVAFRSLIEKDGRITSGIYFCYVYISHYLSVQRLGMIIENLTLSIHLRRQSTISPYSLLSIYLLTLLLYLTFRYQLYISREAI